MIRRSLVFFVLTAVGSACSRGSTAELPPATSAGAPAGPELPKVEVAPEAGRTAVPRRFVATTYVDDRVELAAEASGVLSEVAVDVGDRVEKGQVVFRLKASFARLGLQRSDSALLAAQTRFETTRRELARAEQLAAGGATTPAVLDQARAAHEAATIAVAQAEVGVSEGKTQLSERTMRSPIAGIVTQRFKHPGEAVTMMPPTVVLVVEDQAVLELRMRVPEMALREIAVGKKMRAHFPALDVTRDVVVDRIGAGVDPRTRTIEIVSRLENRDLTLKPGMSADVELIGGPK